MTKEQILQMAREAGFAYSWSEAAGEALERFAALVRNATLEEAAKKCESLDPYNIDKGRETDFVDCADAIRNLKEPT